MIGWQPIETAPADGSDIMIGCLGADSAGNHFWYWVEDSRWENNSWELSPARAGMHRGALPATHWAHLNLPEGVA